LKLIYNCYGGSHSSVTSAAIHLGLLPDQRTATKEELLKVPYYDAQVAQDHGRIRFLGYDENGHEVYVVGRMNLGAGYEKIIRSLVVVLEGRQEDIALVDTMPYVNIFMMIGGYLSRRLGFSRVGRSIIIFGTKLSYHRFVRLVKSVKARFPSRPEKYL